MKHTTIKIPRKFDYKFRLESVQLISDDGGKIEDISWGSDIKASTHLRWLNLKIRRDADGAEGLTNLLLYVPAFRPCDSPTFLAQQIIVEEILKRCDLAIVRRHTPEDRDSASIMLRGYIDNVKKMRLRFLPSLSSDSSDYVTAYLKELLPRRVLRAVLRSDWDGSIELLNSKLVTSVYSKDNMLMGVEERKYNSLMLSRYACDEVLVIL